MYSISCSFDTKRNLPLYAVVFDHEEKDLDFYPLYLKSAKTRLYDAEMNFKTLKDILCNYKVCLSGFKNYIRTFKLNPVADYQIYDIPDFPIKTMENVSALKKMLVSGLKKLLIRPKEWNKLLADSQFTYAYLEDVGYWHNGEKHPSYEFAYSGRSKSTRSNIQGASIDDDIKPSNIKHDTFICFDWIAADLRTASILSKDEQLAKSFKTSDPYTHLMEQLGDGITREDCKLELFHSFYSIDYNSPVLEMYPQFAKWMKETSDKIEKDGFSESILGRQFTKEKERTEKSVFNAQVQGSVAHAMQSVLCKIFRLCKENLMTEIHDSLVLSCASKDVDKLVGTVSEVMRKPFSGILVDDPTFPIKVSVGHLWKQWKEIAEFR